MLGLGTAASESGTLPLGLAHRGWLCVSVPRGLAGYGGSGQHRAVPALLGSAGRRTAALFQGCGVPVAAGQGWPWGCIPCSNTGYGACRYVRLQD